MVDKKAAHINNNNKSHASEVEGYEVPSYANHPFFIKKTEKAKAFLKKAGLPKKYTERHKI